MDEELDAPSECCRRSFGESLKDTARRLLEDPRPAPKSVSLLRLGVCEGCEHYSNSKTCELCQCYMPLKTTMANMACPLEKWTEWKSNS